MPTNRKRVARSWRGTGTIANCQKEYLIYGSIIIQHYDIPEGTTEKFPFHSEEERKALWLEHRDYLMSAIGKDRLEEELSGIPYGERPAAWWDYEAQEPRKMIKPATCKCEPSKEIFMGKPKVYDIDKAEDIKKLPVYETQLEYLERLGLLLPGEKEKALENDRPKLN